MLLLLRDLLPEFSRGGSSGGVFLGLKEMMKRRAAAAADVVSLMPLGSGALRIRSFLSSPPPSPLFFFTTLARPPRAMLPVAFSFSSPPPPFEGVSGAARENDGDDDDDDDEDEKDGGDVAVEDGVSVVGKSGRRGGGDLEPPVMEPEPAESVSVSFTSSASRWNRHPGDDEMSAAAAAAAGLWLSPASSLIML
jgi:hypothetical protein